MTQEELRHLSIQALFNAPRLQLCKKQGSANRQADVAFTILNGSAPLAWG
jgi:hypothetical protein